MRADLVAQALLARPGARYLVYLPSGGSASIDLSGYKGSFTAQWHDPRGGQFSSAVALGGGNVITCTAPDGNDWVLYVHKP